MSTGNTITLKLVEHGERIIEVDRHAYEQAKRDEELDHFLDSYASNMGSRTVVVEPDGTEFDPFDQPGGPQ